MSTVALLQRMPLFADVPAAALSTLAAKTDVRAYEAGDVILRAGAPQTAVVVVASGAVTLYRRNPQTDVTLLLGILVAPALFGDAECAAGVPWLVSARAEVATTCAFAPNAAFLALVDHTPGLAARLYRDASVRHLLANHTAQTLALYDVETRLLRFLLEYAFRFGKAEGDRVVIPSTLTQVDMAAALGVNRKTIARTLRPLVERGVVSRQGAEWAIHGVAELNRRLPAQLLGLSSRLEEAPMAVTSRWLAAINDEER